MSEGRDQRLDLPLLAGSLLPKGRSPTQSVDCAAAGTCARRRAPASGGTGDSRCGLFRFYCTHFNSVEINTSFYGLPKTAWVRRWATIAPPGFLFAVKRNRSITHDRRLVNCGQELSAFFGSIEPLGSRAGVILWQLPPSLHADLQVLRQSLHRLPERYRHAFEFRHRTWFTPQTAELLAEKGGSLVGVSEPGSSMVPPVTTDLVYMRFHGLADGHRHDYKEEELRPWADYKRAQAVGGRRVCAYFNNDGGARAPANAQLLTRFIAVPGRS